MAERDFAVVEDFIVADLASAFPALATVKGVIHVAKNRWPQSNWDTYLGTSATAETAFALVTRIGGAENGVSTDYPVLDISLLSRNLNFAGSLAESIRTRYTRYPRLVKHGGRSLVLGKARTLLGPHPAPWTDESMHHVHSSYEFRARR